MTSLCMGLWPDSLLMPSQPSTLVLQYSTTPPPSSVTRTVATPCTRPHDTRRSVSRCRAAIFNRSLSASMTVWRRPHLRVISGGRHVERCNGRVIVQRDGTGRLLRHPVHQELDQHATGQPVGWPQGETPGPVSISHGGVRERACVWQLQTAHDQLNWL